MEEQFVTYEIALKLKELDFNEPCLACFTDGEIHFEKPDYLLSQQKANYIFKFRNTILAPLWQQVIDWLREKYNLLIDSPKLDEWNIGKWSVKITSLDNSIVLEEYVGQPYWRIYRCFRTYEEAREQAILKCIELLN